jgi:broad specificity phosphatase PhoE
MTGWTDLPADLSDTAAVARLAQALPLVPVLSSDLSRARTTADALQGPRPRLPHDPRWREIHFGAWEGLTYAEVPPAATRAFWDGTAPAPDGEGWADLSARVTAALHDLPGETIVVAHFGAILAAVQAVTGWSLAETLSHRINPLSLTEIDRAAGRVLRINHNP